MRHPVLERLAGLAFLLVVLGYSTIHWQGRVLPDALGRNAETRAARFADFDCYLNAARHLQSGHSPYDERIAQPPLACVNEELAEYVYPPFLAVVLAGAEPILSCRLELAWFGLNLLLCAALVPLLMATSASRWSPWAAGWIVFLVFAPMATLENIALGQVNLVVLALLLVTWSSLRFERRGPGELALASAVAIKMTPAILLLLYARRPHRRRALLGLSLTAVLIGAPFVMLPSSSVGEFLHAISTKAQTQLLMPNNASLHAGIARAFGIAGGWSARLVAGVLALAAVAMVVARLRRVPDLGNDTRVFALLLCAMVAVSPQLESHHLVYLYPAHAILAKHLWIHSVSWFRRGRAMAGLTLILVLLNSRGLSLPPALGEALGGLLAKPAGIAVWAELILAYTVVSSSATSNPMPSMRH